MRLSSENGRTITGMIRSRLTSEKGASITFALLLFLVCAMVSAVVIVAATTASGRMANIAEADQRYYAVTSAAELLKDSMSEKTVTVMTVGSETVAVAKPANEITAEEIERAGITVIPDDYIPAGNDDKSYNGNDYEHVQRPATSGTPSTDALVKKLSELTLQGEGEAREFSFDIDVNGNEELKVRADVSIDENDNATFVLYNTKGRPFKMTMDFTADATHGIRPAVAGVDISSSNEVSWHLERVLTSYDASVMDAKED